MRGRFNGHNSGSVKTMKKRTPYLFSRPIKEIYPRTIQHQKNLNKNLSSIKSEITDPRNRTAIKCNLPVEELDALKELIRLQRKQVIIVKACDKGSGIIILDFNVYFKACYDHLLAK